MARKRKKNGAELRVVDQVHTRQTGEIDTGSYTATPNAHQRRSNGQFAPGNTMGRRTLFQPGNTAALTHGLRARPEGIPVASDLDGQELLPRSYEFLRTEVRQFVEACLEDEGGSVAAIPARRRALLEYRARLDRRIRQLDAALEVRGLVDRGGKLRQGWLQRLEGLIHTAKAIDSLLGLDRRVAPVPTVEDFLTSVGSRSRGSDSLRHRTHGDEQ